jgi:hypothetical protein
MFELSRPLPLFCIQWVPCFSGIQKWAKKRAPKTPKSATSVFVRVVFSHGPLSDLFWKIKHVFWGIGEPACMHIFWKMTLCQLWPSSRGGTRVKQGPFFGDFGRVFIIPIRFDAKKAIRGWLRAGQSRTKKEPFQPVRLKKKRRVIWARETNKKRVSSLGPWD